MMKTVLSILAIAALFLFAARVHSEPPAGDSLNDGASYIGADACKKCHMGQHRTWKKMKHANAWENLPAKYRDPAQKDEQGRSCVQCHVTGWGHGDVGGFVDAEKSADMVGVQCEACHGPGSKHREAGDALIKAKAKEFPAGAQTFITRKTTACSDCHNPHINHEKYKEG